MKRAFAIPLAFLLSAQSPPPASVTDLAWMSGSWVSEDGESWTEEHWSAPRAGAMIGYSRSGRGAAMREYEYIRIETGADGAPAYVALPGGASAAVRFPLARSDAGSVTFENAAHDYPQRIVYRRAGEGIEATISLIDGSRARSWRYQRR